ncbi:MAG: YqaJ viral recombinase family protein, partial [Muribaculaceae bacterium]|nr:YqaJ viral recombinase family protein [Muribaculaceae bacterium]
MPVSTLPRKGQSPTVMVNTAGLTREQWLAWRRRGIGGSDVAAILGISPFRTARDIFYDKLGIAPAEPDEGNWVALEMGNLLEDLVAKIFSRKTGFSIFQIKKMFRHAQYPFMLADVDFFATLPNGETTILEIKTTNYNARDHWWSPDGREIVPAWYETQVRHYMAVMDIDRAFLCCLYGNNEDEVIIREVKRDAAYEEEMIYLEKNFWENHVQAKCPPPYVEDGDLIVASARRYGGPADPQAQAVALDAGMTDTLMQYLRLTDEKKQSETISKKREEEIQRLRGILIAQMGPSCIADCERDGIRYTVTYKPTRKTGINKDSLERLKLLHPDIYEQFVTVT